MKLPIVKFQKKTCNQLDFILLHPGQYSTTLVLNGITVTQSGEPLSYLS